MYIRLWTLEINNPSIALSVSIQRIPLPGDDHGMVVPLVGSGRKSDVSGSIDSGSDGFLVSVYATRCEVKSSVDS